MQSFFQKHHRVLFYTTWIILGLIQSRFTELQDDEAYYWVYSRYPDWGYFDHPPMIAILIKIGYWIFPNELGVRLLPLLLNTFSLILIEKLTVKKQPFLFYAIVLSVAVLQVSGFVAVPDIPLIFFTALFFWCYKRFTRDLSILSTLLLGLSIALLFYSKYHAVLIVFFTLLSNPRLLTRYQTWLAGLFALVLFAPHLWWQYQHDWVSFRYHLFENHVNVYKPSFSADYIIGQLVLPGPLAGFILLPAAFLFQPKEPTEKALKFTMIGIYIFFLLSSLRGNVEANWTAPALIAILVLSHQFLQERIKWQKWLFRLLPATMVLVLFARVVMIVDVLPLKFAQKRYHAWKQWPAEMRESTKESLIVFNNSYQQASKYWFYSGQMTYSQNWFRERKNNFNYWPIEDSMLGKPVHILDRYDVHRFPDSLKTPIGWIGYRYETVFNSFAKVNIETSPKKLKIKQGEAFWLSCKTILSQYYYNYISTNEITCQVKIGIFGKKGWIKDLDIPHSLRTMISQIVEIKIDPELPAGKYYLRFAIHVHGYIPTHNSGKITLIVK